ncbi:chloride transport protein 6-like [Etheostoma cragini]|uniref:chloride transport protein 6-like n=1 Tax=Etheostoma cragini TaxID=417921 RepID=UPI00155EFD34|nr:chloride transport protein 6-like [Etheostoma cragini]
MACCGNCFCCQCCCGEGETRTPEELAILGEIQVEEDEILPRKDYESLDYDRCISEPYMEVLEGMDSKSAAQPRLSYAEMTEDYPRYPDIHDLDLALLNPRMIVDVTPYMNPCPYTVSPNTHISQVFNLFRTMGLRHLPVVNAVGEPGVRGQSVEPSLGQEPGARSLSWSQEPGFWSLEPGPRTPEPILELGARSSEPRAGSREPSLEPKPGARSQDPGAQSLEPGARTLEPGSWSLEPRAWSRSQDPGAWSQDSGARILEPKAQSPEPGARSQDPGAYVFSPSYQFQSITFKRIKFDFPYFRSDRDKRDFVSAGAAAGVAAAFGAPIGGTLFSLEEGCSFWNQGLTWKVLFCSMSATFTLNFFRSGLNFNKWGSFQLPGLLNFGEFKCSDGDKNCHLWTAVDLAFFVLMGVVGGLLGALFNCMNKCLAKYRIRHIHPKAKFVRVLESLLVAMVTTVVIFAASILLGECRDLSSPTTHNTTLSGSEDINSTVRQFFCNNKTYNDMATLFFNPQEAAIHQLFHQEGTFSPVTLSVFFLLYFLLACWTYGLSVPSGLFVPSLLCGAAFGRLVANILKV